MSFPGGMNGNEVGQETIVKFSLFPLWIILNKTTPISKWNAGSCIYGASNIATLVKHRLILVLYFVESWNEL